MAAPVTPQRVEEEIRRLSRRLEQKADELPALFQAAAEAEAAYRLTYAKALLTSDKKTVSEREADALVACERLFNDRLVKQAVADATKEAVRATQVQLTAACSVGASLRAEMSLAGPLGRTA